MNKFKKELEHIINTNSIENECDMPDFILAEMVVGIIEVIGKASKQNLDWHGTDSICHPKKGMEDIKKWTQEELQKNIRTNFYYGATVITAALYKKLYGEFPKCGMSGQQVEFAKHIFEHLPVKY